MRNPFIAVMVILTLGAGLARADERRFSAADVPGAGIHKPGKIVIRNDSRSITAFHFFDDVSEALVTLRSTRTLAFRPYGTSVFDSNARLSAPVPAYLSAIIADAAKTHGV